MTRIIPRQAAFWSSPGSHGLHTCRLAAVSGPRIHRCTSSGFARHGCGHFFALRLAITDRAKTMTELEEAIQDLELEAAEDLALDEFGDE